MTYFISVPKLDAEKVRAIIQEKSLWTQGYKTERDEEYVYFPILHKNCKELRKYKIRQKEGKTYARTKSLKEILTKEFKIKDYISSYDTVGDIVIFKFTPEMERKEKEISQMFLQTNPTIKTVVKKTEAHAGKYRIEKIKYLAGKRSFKTTVNESGCSFIVELNKMFFSTRLSFERLRISKIVKDDSTVAVFFGGVGPFSILIGKKKPKCKVYSIELNRAAHLLAKQNVKLNKTPNVIPVCADVKKYAKKIEGKCDYVIMPLPKTADLFLDSAYTAIKKRENAGVITIYKFVPKENPYKEILDTLKKFAKEKNKKLKVLFKREVRDYSPGTVQIVVDFCFIKK